MNPTWNKVIYKVWSPIYDKLFNSGVFLQARRRVFQEIPFQPGQRLLFVGVGTGADLEVIPHSDLEITAIDFSPDMLARAMAKFQASHITFLEMDAQRMEFPDAAFDYVIGSLILSVVPDADRCLQEMERVLRPGGQLIVFDKFAPKNQQLSLPRKLLRPLIRVLGTDIGLNFEELHHKNKKSLRIEEDTPVMMNGMYRKMILSKTHE